MNGSQKDSRWAQSRNVSAHEMHLHCSLQRTCATTGVHLNLMCKADSVCARGWSWREYLLDLVAFLSKQKVKDTELNRESYCCCWWLVILAKNTLDSDLHNWLPGNPRGKKMSVQEAESVQRCGWKPEDNNNNNDLFSTELLQQLLCCFRQSAFNTLTPQQSTGSTPSLILFGYYDTKGYFIVLYRTPKR